MRKILQPTLDFIDRLLHVPESKATYLTKVTPIDRVLAATFLKLFPSAVTPNRITKFRLWSIPVIGILLWTGEIKWGTVLFLFAAFSDALDGAMARTQKKVTNWGTLYDPIADKLLIGLVATIIVSKYIHPYFALAIVAIEIALIAFAYFRYKGKVVPAKTIGKTKMVLQCFGVIFLLFYIVTGATMLLTLATYTLLLAIFFALLSLFIFKSI